MVGWDTAISWPGDVIETLGSVGSNVTVRFPDDALPARSVALTSIVFIPLTRVTAVENVAPLMTAVCVAPLFRATVTVAVSSTVPVTVETGWFVVPSSAGDSIVSVGAF